MKDSAEKRFRIPVTQPFLPPKAEYDLLLDSVWDRNWLTNDGPLVRELEVKLHDYLDLDDCELIFVSSGTLALQIAIKALGRTGEIVTTPFSYVATTSSIIWEGCHPVFADIDPETLNIDPGSAADSITDRTVAILATHVFGAPCETGALQEIADRHKLPVIYDAAHAFGSLKDGRSLFAYGDVSIASFHATKLFHTVEGGALITNSSERADRYRYMRNFGHDGPGKFNGVGINGKNSEFHAAMGLANLPYADAILKQREDLSRTYDRLLKDSGVQRAPGKRPEGYNFSYYPVLFASEQSLLHAQKLLHRHKIQTRRYFYPGLSELDYIVPAGKHALPVTDDISRRILCLPLYHQLKHDEIQEICDLVSSATDGS